jgi:hypothetical protein
LASFAVARPPDPPRIGGGEEGKRKEVEREEVEEGERDERKGGEEKRRMGRRV